MSKTIEKIQAFKEAKSTYKEAKEEMFKLQAELWIEMSGLGFDTLGTKETGQVTAVYRTNYLFTPEAKTELRPIVGEKESAVVILDGINKALKEKEKELIGAGMAKEDREFSYIKYTAPKKK